MYSSNDQKMMPQRKRNFDLVSGVARPLTSVKISRFGSSYGSPCGTPTFPYYAAEFCPRAPFGYRPPYQHRKPPHSYSSTPPYAVNNFTSTQHSSNWHGPSRAYSPWIYKNPQNMTQGCRDSFTTIPNRKHHNCKGSGTVYSAENFDVNDYVIPAMTSNPWAKLEEFYASRRLDKQ